MRRLVQILATASTAILLFMTVNAQAELVGDIGVDVRIRSAGGDEMPALTLTAQKAVRNVVVVVTRVGGDERTFKIPNLGAQESKLVTWPQEAGRAYYRASITYSGQREPSEIRFSAAVAADFDLFVEPEDVDLEAGTIAFRADGPVDKVRFWIYGEGGREIFRRELHMNLPSGRPKGLKFEPITEPVVQVKLVAYDAEEFTHELTFTPYVVEIPHDELAFEFGKADVQNSETPKLERTLVETRKALDKVGKSLKFRLYIAGYTDTVGGHDYNLDLSHRRAKTVAEWLKSHGLPIPVCSRGFGESVLAVQTPDETAEPANRISRYVLAAQAPMGKDFPGGGWVCE